jgi:hypothetical protein
VLPVWDWITWSVRGVLETVGVGEVFPFAPAVEVDECLHAAPFFDFRMAFTSFLTPES